MGRKKKYTGPTNTEAMESLQRMRPQWTFDICGVCGEYCVVNFADIGNENFHPLCMDDPKAEKLRKKRNKIAGSLLQDSLL